MEYLHWVLVGLLALFAVARYFFTKGRDNSPRFEHAPSERSRFLLSECPLLRKGYSSSILLKNRHFHACISVMWPLLAPVKFEREVVYVRDGGRVALDWGVQHQKVSETTPVVIVLHGIAGDSTSTYVRSFCRRTLDKGWRTVVYNKRGHGGLTLSTPHLPAFADTCDFTEVVAHVHKKYPQAPLLGAGFSGGTGLLACYLGEQGEKSLLSGALVVSAGYDPVKVFCSDEQKAKDDAADAERLRRTGIKQRRSPQIPWFYDRLITHELKRMLRSHDVLKSKLDMEKTLASKRLFQLDQAVYVPLNGFNDLTSYWEKNNPMNYFHDVRRPFLCLNAEDDPVCTKEMIPYDWFPHNHYTILAATPEGSHCGFVDGFFRNGAFSSWADKVGLEFFDAVLRWDAMHPHAHRLDGGSPRSDRE